MPEVKPVHLPAVLAYWGVASEDEPLALVNCPTCHKIVCACDSQDHQQDSVQAAS